MSVKVEAQIQKIPIIRDLMRILQRIRLPLLEGLSLYELLEMYTIGIIEGAISYRATAIAFSFFMALFPFALFILNLIPYIPINGFQEDFLEFVSKSVPPNTYDAIANIINDILSNSQTSLLSSGFLLSIFLQANGINAVLGGFETSKLIEIRRGFLRQYMVSLGMSLLLNFLLIATVAIIIIVEVFLQKIKLQDVLNDNIQVLEISRFVFVIAMILVTVSVLFTYGIKRDKNRSFISVGSIFTTLLIIFSSYFFGIWVVKFSKYNELYGSIGTLLIMMFYIWINCMILLLGFELNATINKHKNDIKKLKTID